MLIKEEKIKINGKEVVLRCARKEDAPTLKNYLITVSEETNFLLCDPDEINYALEQEEAFIISFNETERDLLLLVFVEGEFAGDCSMRTVPPSRRNAHRTDFGIALFQKYTGMGIGTILLEKLIEMARDSGFEQCELTVVSTNERAIKLYKRLGFVECGRIPNANKYQDGSYSDNINMVLKVDSEN